MAFPYSLFSATVGLSFISSGDGFRVGSVFLKICASGPMVMSGMAIGVMLAPEFYHYHDTLSTYKSRRSIENIKTVLTKLKQHDSCIDDRN